MDRIIHFLVSFLLVFSAILARAEDRLVGDTEALHSIDLEQTNILVVPFQEDQTSINYFKSRFPFIKFKIIYTDKERSPELSTGDIVKALRETDRPVSLYCMGKAASDCLESLLQYPNLQEHVEQLVSFRGFVKGADYAENSRGPLNTMEVSQARKMPLIKAIEFLLEGLAYLLDGYDPALFAMNPAVRQQYLSDNESKIRNLARKVDLTSLEVGPNGYGEIPYSKAAKNISN